MRGLPRPPSSVARAVMSVVTDGTHSSVGMWFFMPELPIATFPDIDAVAGQLRVAMSDLLINLMASAGDLREFAFFTYGDAPLSIHAPISGLGGGLGACQALNASTGIYWSTNARGKSGRCLTHVPAFPDAFTSDHVHLNPTGVDAVRGAADDFLVTVGTVASGPILSCALVTLKRERAGAPLPVAEIAFIDHGVACPVIAGMQRRLTANR